VFIKDFTDGEDVNYLIPLFLNNKQFNYKLIEENVLSLNISKKRLGGFGIFSKSFKSFNDTTDLESFIATTREITSVYKDKVLYQITTNSHPCKFKDYKYFIFI